MPKKLRNVLKLVGLCLGLWLFFAALGPLLENIPAWQTFSRVSDEEGLDSGALYYTNVPQTQDAEIALRSAVKAGMKDRREKRRSGENGN